MKVPSASLVIMAMGVLGFVLARGAEPARGDHLAPLAQVDERITKYQALLRAKLGITPFDCGRVLNEPSFEPESVVSVYSPVQGGQQRYHVTLVTAKANIWQETESMHHVDKAAAVNIERIDAEIPQGVAEHIRQVWLQMLLEARPWQRAPLEFQLSGYLRFSIGQAKGPPLEAELSLPPRGPKTQALAKLSDALWEYCKAAPADRPAIASKIDRQAAGLLRQLR